MLEGENVNLRVMEREDLPLYVEWLNNPEVMGEYNPIQQKSRIEMEKKYDTLPPEEKTFIIMKKDGSKIGYVGHYPEAGGKLFEIGFALLPREREKGYGAEAVKIMVDYLFLSKNIVRIQAHTDPRNVASQKVLEKAGFQMEGTIRKSFFIRGEWRNTLLYSILREEWKEPRMLKTSKARVKKL